MRRSSVTWLALALLLSLALLAASSPDTNPEAAVKTEGTKTDGASAATKNVASDNHYKYRDGEYDGYEPDHEGYPWVEGHKKYDGDYKPDYYGGEGHKDYDGDKPDYYRGDSHLGHGKYGYPHKPKHHGYYPKPPPVVPCPACPENTTACDSQFSPNTQCFDLSTGIPFCGKCGNVCPGGAKCNNGTCECTGDLKPCPTTDGNFTCVSFANDPANCGSCNNTCTGTTPFCKNGTCAPNPPACEIAGQVPCFPSTSANGTCTNLNTDANNCGRCGKSCIGILGTGSTCTEGKCCVPNKGKCLSGLQCCGFNPLAFIPGVGEIVATARCEGPNPLQKTCCKGQLSICTDTDVCCGTLKCRGFGTKICLP